MSAARRHTRSIRGGRWLAVALLLAGCGSPTPGVQPEAPAKTESPRGTAGLPGDALHPTTAHRKPGDRTDPARGRRDSPLPTEGLQLAQADPHLKPPLTESIAPTPAADDAKVRRAGVQKYTGKHITLYSDVDPEKIKPLPAVFDAAVAQWAKYFQVKADNWHVRGHVMADANKFQAAGLWRDDMPEFRNGYAFYDAFWLHDQKSDYYRRHLLLHEGTHAFMYAQLEGSGPPWYMEGMAELLGTHKLTDDGVIVGYMPGDKEEVPLWGRVKIVVDEYRAGRGMPLEAIFNYDSRAHLQNEPYGWCWAAAAFFDGHPRYRERFRKLAAQVRKLDFNRAFRTSLGDDLPQANLEWQVFVASLEYGHDVARSAIVFRPGKSFSGKAQVTVAADRGWQSSGLRVEAGQPYQLKAAGQFQIAVTTQPWPCEPGGVSIRYYRGRPLGILLAAVQPDGADASGLLKPIPIGLGAKILPETAGTLYFKVNDSPAELADNKGTLTVEVGE